MTLSATEGPSKREMLKTVACLLALALTSKCERECMHGGKHFSGWPLQEPIFRLHTCTGTVNRKCSPMFVSENSRDMYCTRNKSRLYQYHEAMYLCTCTCTYYKSYYKSAKNAITNVHVPWYVWKGT